MTKFNRNPSPRLASTPEKAPSLNCVAAPFLSLERLRRPRIPSTLASLQCCGRPLAQRSQQ
jgi:hypothetical protein